MQSSGMNGMEISAQKTKVMTDSNEGISKENKVRGDKLETLTLYSSLVSAQCRILWRCVRSMSYIAALCQINVVYCCVV